MLSESQRRRDRFMPSLASRSILLWLRWDHHIEICAFEGDCDSTTARCINNYEVALVSADLPGQEPVNTLYQEYRQFPAEGAGDLLTLRATASEGPFAPCPVGDDGRQARPTSLHLPQTPPFVRPLARASMDGASTHAHAIIAWCPNVGSQVPCAPLEMLYRGARISGFEPPNNLRFYVENIELTRVAAINDASFTLGAKEERAATAKFANDHRIVGGGMRGRGGDGKQPRMKAVYIRRTWRASVSLQQMFRAH